MKLLQLSTAHSYIYMSWNVLEAMNVAGAIAASNTDPVKEVIAHNKIGLLVDFLMLMAYQPRSLTY